MCEADDGSADTERKGIDTLPDGSITLRTEQGVQVLYGPDGTVRSRHYLVNGVEVHEVNPNSPATLRGVQAASVDPLAPSKMVGNLAAEVSPTDPSQLLVRPPSGYADKPLSLTRATGGTMVPKLGVPMSGASKLIYTIADGVDTNQTVLLEGHPGLGKTYGALWLASMLGYNAVVLQVTANIEEDSLTGTYRPVIVETENGTFAVPKYIYSQVAKAVVESQTHPTFLIVDELNRARSQGVFTALFSLLQEGWLGGIFSEDGTQEKLYVGEGNLHVIATQNPSPRNDPDGMYYTQNLDDALLTRFPVQAMIEWPTPEEQAAILMVHERNGDPGLALRVSKMAHSVRTARDSGLPQPLSTRNLVAFFKAVTRGRSVQLAYESRINDVLPVECRDAVRKFAFGEGVL